MPYKDFAVATQALQSVGVGRGRVAVVVAKTQRWKSVLLTPPCYLSRILIRMLHAEEKGMMKNRKPARTIIVVADFPYGLAVNPLGGITWYSAVGVPGKLVRVDRGSNPPATCRTEMFEPFQLRPDPLAH